MSKLIYVETSVPSFYFDTRSGHDMQAMRQWTRQWWTLPKRAQELVVGVPVLAELNEAPALKREKALELIEKLRILPYVDELAEIVEAYFAHKLMPLEAQGVPTISRSLHFTIAMCWRPGIANIWQTRINSGIFTGSMDCWVCERLRSSPRSNFWSRTMKTKPEDGLEWLRKIRARLAKQFDYDPHKAGAYYRRVQKMSGAKIYQPKSLAETAVLHDRALAEIAAGQFTTLKSYRAARQRKTKRSQ